MAQVINLGSYPVITRLYLPEHLGTFTVFISTAAIFAVFACGRFDAVIQAARFCERFAAFAIARRINVAVALIAMVLFYLVVNLIGTRADLIQTLLLGSIVYMTGYSNAATMFLLKHERFRESAQSMVLRTLLTALPQIALFHLIPTAMGMSIGFCVGFAAQSAFLHHFIRFNLPWRSTTKKQMRCVLYKYRRYLQFDVPSQFLSILSLTALNYCLLYLFAPKEVGYYSVSYRLAALPLGVFSSSLSHVFFQKASKSFQERSVFWNELKFNLYTSAALSFVIYSLLALLAEPLTEIYLGPNWLPAADIFVYISPMLALRFVSVTIATTPLVIGKPQVLLINNVCLLISIGVAFLIAQHGELGLAPYLVLNTITTSTVYLVFIVYIVVVTRKNYRVEAH